MFVLGVLGSGLLFALATSIGTTADLIRATSACFIAVYVVALASGVRILRGRIRMAAAVALGLVIVVAVFSSRFLLVPAAAAVVSLGLRRLAHPSATGGESSAFRQPAAR